MIRHAVGNTGKKHVLALHLQRSLSASFDKCNGFSDFSSFPIEVQFQIGAELGTTHPPYARKSYSIG